MHEYVLQKVAEAITQEREREARRHERRARSRRECLQDERTERPGRTPRLVMATTEQSE